MTSKLAPDALFLQRVIVFWPLSAMLTNIDFFLGGGGVSKIYVDHGVFLALKSSKERFFLFPCVKI